MTTDDDWPYSRTRSGRRSGDNPAPDLATLRRLIKLHNATPLTDELGRIYVRCRDVPSFRSEFVDEMYSGNDKAGELYWIHATNKVMRLDGLLPQTDSVTMKDGSVHTIQLVATSSNNRQATYVWLNHAVL